MNEEQDNDLAGWIKQYSVGLRRYFARRVNDADVDDLVQEVFVHLQAKRQDTAIDNPQSYTFTVARNVLISHYRRQKTRSHAFQESLTHEMEIPDFISPERTAIGIEEYRRVVQAILNLPPRARAAFQFHRFENMTYQAIAKRMGISKESVKELIHRALVQIRQARGEES
ncbi:RNA polymerase sigma factor [Exilibacterium tricleocarpae]|uniref:RNA polymerase sigma factor n=1 Tax=Exilibacterium tricleocarpae TaxID=2591008 RepID=A0A545TNZ5_9GAMM|nr:RNA polymerase sigma factor [Exilibacterium tricleocarpae]TQV78891.1 RNA polymerase sigma factor [Exilibacterium tricleocarpae]